MHQTLRALLLLSTSLALIACDDKDSGSKQDASSHQAAMEKKMADMSAAIADMYPDQTLSGSFLSGQFAQIHSDWNNASTYFDAVRELDPNAPMIENRIMALSVGSGHFDRAITLAKKLSQEKTATDQSLAIMLTGLEPFKAKSYDETLRLLSEAPKEGLGSAVIPLLRAWAAAGNGKTDVAALLDKSSLSYQAVMIAGYNKDKKTIADIARKFDFVSMPISIHNLEDVATVFAMNGEEKAARALFVALKNGLPERSEFYSERIKDIDSGNLTAFKLPYNTPQEFFAAALINVSQLLGKSYQDSSRIFAQMAYYLQPSSDDALELLAQIAANDEQNDEAISYLQRIDTKNDIDKVTQVQRQVALLLQKSGKNGEAIRILEDLVSKSKNIDAQIQIGDIYRIDEKYKESLDAYNKAFDLLGDNIPQKHWDLLFARGMVNERLKNWDQAEKDLKGALSYEPDQPYVLNYLGYSWADQGKNLDKATEMIEKAVRLKPTDGSIVDSLGWVYFRMGSFDKSVKTLEKAIELDSTEAEINDHLGDAYWRVGRKNEARFQWKRAMSFTTDPTLTTTISHKLENGLPEISSHAPQAKMVQN